MSIKLVWDLGAGYDMFMSLDALYHPEEFELRGAWAAGVRSRLPTTERETLQQAHLFYKGPLYWVYTLPAPKDGKTVLKVLGEMSPAERLRALIFYPGMPANVKDVLEEVAARQSWNEKDQRVIRTAYQPERISPKGAANLLEMWVKRQEFGERYLAALRAYYEVFFAEEEDRIRPALHRALSRAQEMAQRLEVPELLGELSEGFHFAEALQLSELILAPSFWITPLVAYINLPQKRMLFVFGGRPPDASIVPGEMIPDALFRPLKALADPTRLRILRHLTAEPLTPAQLARRLRLRAPTVIHHLRTLRLAGLVHLTLEAGKKVHYTVRSEAVTHMAANLKDFLEKDAAPD